MTSRLVLFAVIAGGCGGGPRRASLGPEDDVCRSREDTQRWPASTTCCREVGIVGAAALGPACAPPDPSAVLACVQGDPSRVTGIHRLPGGRVALLTEHDVVCGGMARGTMTAEWVLLPDHPGGVAMVHCGGTREDCRGPGRP